MVQDLHQQDLITYLTGEQCFAKVPMIQKLFVFGSWLIKDMFMLASFNLVAFVLGGIQGLLALFYR